MSLIFGYFYLILFLSDLSLKLKKLRQQTKFILLASMNLSTFRRKFQHVSKKKLFQFQKFIPFYYIRKSISLNSLFLYLKKKFWFGSSVVDFNRVGLFKGLKFVLQPKSYSTRAEKIRLQPKSGYNPLNQPGWKIFGFATEFWVCGLLTYFFFTDRVTY